jgi:hypothetical protein
VDLHVLAAGSDDRLLRASLASGARGLVLEGTGAGNVPPAVLPGIRAALRARVPVVVVSRCAEGRVAPLYGFEGGGQRLAEMGAVLAGDLGGPKARIRLMVALGLTSDPPRSARSSLSRACRGRPSPRPPRAARPPSRAASDVGNACRLAVPPEQVARPERACLLAPARLAPQEPPEPLLRGRGVEAVAPQVPRVAGDDRPPAQRHRVVEGRTRSPRASSRGLERTAHALVLGEVEHLEPGPAPDRGGPARSPPRRRGEPATSAAATARPHPGEHEEAKIGGRTAT